MDDKRRVKEYGNMQNLSKLLWVLINIGCTKYNIMHISIFFSNIDKCNNFAYIIQDEFIEMGFDFKKSYREVIASRSSSDQSCVVTIRKACINIRGSRADYVICDSDIDEECKNVVIRPVSIYGSYIEVNV